MQVLFSAFYMTFNLTTHRHFTSNDFRNSFVHFRPPHSVPAKPETHSSCFLCFKFLWEAYFCPKLRIKPHVTAFWNVTVIHFCWRSLLTNVPDCGSQRCQNFPKPQKFPYQQNILHKVFLKIFNIAISFHTATGKPANEMHSKLYFVFRMQQTQKFK